MVPFPPICLLFRHPLFSLLRLGARTRFRSAVYSLFIPNSAHQQKAPPSFLFHLSTFLSLLCKVLSCRITRGHSQTSSPLHLYSSTVIINPILLPTDIFLPLFSCRLFEPNSIQTPYSEVLHMTTITGYFVRLFLEEESFE